ncbi:MAG TPA: OadG family protein [Candidatus Aphodomonas merdavium]|nr:OadG family protein [Candidatus Aphodomonas merdavium]
MVFTGLKVTIVGLLVVFFGLAILIVCIEAMNKGLGRKTQKSEAKVAAHAAPVPPAPAVPRTYVPGPKLQPGDPALYAVLTAAVARTLESEGVNPEGGFKIVSVKPM